MNIRELIENSTAELQQESGAEITSLSYDSREVEAGACFFAYRGSALDGHIYIDKAIERGAVAVVCEELPERLCEGVSYAVAEDVQAAMAAMAAIFYGNPSREIKLIGVTGTNGKTTTATLLADLFEELGYSTGLISTVLYRVGNEIFNSTHTTPDTIRLNAMLRKMVNRGCSYCFMEVSSHAVVQRRVAGLEFTGAIFTNLTHDHLDYHGTFAEYIKAKKGLFDGLSKGAFALINRDDRNGEVMVQNCKARVARYSLRSMADFRAKVIEMLFDGMLLDISGECSSEQVWVQILGRFNASNLIAAYGAATLLGVESNDILVAMSKLRPVNGRFEHFAAEGERTVIIDYAHTPDAINSVLECIGEIKRDGQRVITVCGCGGDRDHTKRGEMARIALRGSEVAIFTSDNPRTEDPEEILREMIEGVKGETTTHKWLKISDRAEAIRTAVMLSEPRDIILIAGKGHENYQIIGKTKHHFDDHEVAREAVKQYLS